MSSTNANGATWYVLRYAEDFRARPTSGPNDPFGVELGPDLFYDEARGVLELLPARPQTAVPPPPGLAVDVDGEVYRVDPRTGILLVRRCDGSEVALVREPGVLAAPAGLALDRRGFLHIADAAARRVVVVLPEDGSVRDVLDGLECPVDVAVSPAGLIYVADAGAGQIVVFDAGHERIGAFAAQDGAGLPAKPVPIAVMVDADESILVADATHPRLLRFDRTGAPLADAELAALVATVEGGDVALEALEKSYGSRLPRFFAGACAPPRPARDGGARLAEVHRAIRLLALRLGRAFELAGTFVSRTLDSGTPGTVWHRIEVDASLPAGTSLTVETATAESVSQLADPATDSWDTPRDTAGGILPATPGVSGQLVQSPPGRYLRLRVALHSDGNATPSLRSLRVYYPRVSYLDLLPQVFRRDPDGAAFLDHFLSLFESVFTRVEDRYEWFSRALDPAAAPPDVVVWLASLIDLSFDPSWPLERRRALLAAAIGLYKQRGTPEGLIRYIEIYTGVTPMITEDFLQRPLRPAFLGGQGSVLGSSLSLRAVTPKSVPDEQLIRDHAHRFTVLIDLSDTCDADVVLPVVDRIVASNRPAHTVYTIVPQYPEARVGLQSTVGLDLRLGGREDPKTQLGGRPRPGAPAQGAGILGRDAVLGERRPQYARPVIPSL
jgi:phage tail-like protein